MSRIVVTLDGRKNEFLNWELKKYFRVIIFKLTFFLFSNRNKYFECSGKCTLSQKIIILYLKKIAASASEVILSFSIYIVTHNHLYHLVHIAIILKENWSKKGRSWWYQNNWSSFENNEKIYNHLFIPSGIYPIYENCDCLQYVSTVL